LHPQTRIVDQPPVYSLASPIDGTYPEWLDPTYWSAGIVPRFSVTAQLDILKNNLASYFNMLLSAQTGLLFGFLLLVFLGRAQQGHLKSIAAEWPLLVPALAGLALYWPVYVEPRMVGPFFVLLWAGLFGSLRLRDSEEVTRVARAVIVAIAILLGILVVAPGFGDLYQVLRPKPNRQWQVVEGLRRLGLQPGNKIAVIGDSSTAYWARLARCRIVAVIEPADVNVYWAAAPAAKSRVLDALVTTGARVVVSNTVPPGQTADWQPVGSTGFFVYPLQKSP
jgi:hypothetical protein